MNHRLTTTCEIKFGGAERFQLIKKRDIDIPGECRLPLNPLLIPFLEIRCVEPTHNTVLIARIGEIDLDGRWPS